jgi:transcriptional regulator with XRE-family HTH domain
METSKKLKTTVELNLPSQNILLGRMLRTERKRLALSQAAFGACCGVTSRTVIEWEKGTSSPDLQQLYSLSKFGLDLAKFKYESPEKMTMDHYGFKEIFFVLDDDKCHTNKLLQSMKNLSTSFFENPEYTLINMESIFNKKGELIGIRYFYKYPELLVYDESQTIWQAISDTTIADIKNTRYFNKG